MTGVYASITPEGGLQFRDGVPDRMLRDSDARPDAGADSVVLRGRWFTLVRPSGSTHGLSAHAGDGGGPANGVGRRLLVALGASGPPITGELSICGTVVTRETTVLCGLTDAQMRLIRSVHTRARQEEDHGDSD